jgi:hypothetical protein
VTIKFQQFVWTESKNWVFSSSLNELTGFQFQFKWNELITNTSLNEKELSEKFQFHELMWNCHTPSRQSALVPHFRIAVRLFHSNFLAYWWCSWKWSIGPDPTEKMNSIFFGRFQAFEVKEEKKQKKRYFK